MEHGTVSIDTAHYETLIRQSEQLNTIVAMVENDGYITTHSIKSIVGIKYSEGE